MMVTVLGTPPGSVIVSGTCWPGCRAASARSPVLYGRRDDVEQCGTRGVGLGGLVVAHPAVASAQLGPDVRYECSAVTWRHAVKWCHGVHPDSAETVWAPAVRRCASRDAKAMIVNAGFAAPWVGQTEPSQIRTLGTPQIR